MPERTDRRHSDGKKGDQRAAGQRDRDRILYTGAFQRLAGVTQVVGPLEGHVFHNRLTHTLEVAQIARRLAEKLVWSEADLVRELGGLDPDVVEAAALAHDLGHPPFGHVAEKELDALAQKYGAAEGFEGNAQSFRIVTRLAAHRDKYHGLNLTRATLNAVLKYPWSRDTLDPRPENKRYKKYGYYSSEGDDFGFARDGFAVRGARSLEAEVMDYADAVAYSVHDLDDFYRAGLIPLDRLIPERDRPSRELEGFLVRWVQRGGIDQATLDAERPQLESFLSTLPVREPYTGTYEQRALMRTCTSHLIQKFVLAARLQRDTGPGNHLQTDTSLQFNIDFLHGLVEDYVIINPRLGTQQHGQRQVIRTLFEVYLEAVQSRNRAIVPPHFHQELDRAAEVANGSHPEQVRLAVDIVAGFADNQALAMHRRLTGHSPGSVMELLPS
ncbi:MAG TPA: dNTP triphosphohydrolase [Longimicrobium sp.]|jgi:dGTPase